MLDDDEAAGRDQTRAIEKIEDAKIIRCSRVRRVEEDEIREATMRGYLFEAADGIHGKNFRASGDAERLQVFLDELGGGTVIFDEDDLARAAAQSFDSDGAASGESVYEQGIFHGRPENIEKRFAEAIA